MASNCKQTLQLVQNQLRAAALIRQRISLVRSFTNVIHRSSLKNKFLFSELSWAESWDLLSQTHINTACWSSRFLSIVVFVVAHDCCYCCCFFLGFKAKYTLKRVSNYTTTNCINVEAMKDERRKKERAGEIMNDSSPSPLPSLNRPSVRRLFSFVQLWLKLLATLFGCFVSLQTAERANEDFTPKWHRIAKRSYPVLARQQTWFRNWQPLKFQNTLPPHAQDSASRLVRLLASKLNARRSATDVISWDRNVMSPITENITPSTRTSLALTFWTYWRWRCRMAFPPHTNCKSSSLGVKQD